MVQIHPFKCRDQNGFKKKPCKYLLSMRHIKYVDTNRLKVKDGKIYIMQILTNRKLGGFINTRQSRLQSKKKYQG